MPDHDEPSNADPKNFDDRLHWLRIKIDLMPEPQRPHLVELAETIARQHAKLKNRIGQDYDAC